MRIVSTILLFINFAQTLAAQSSDTTKQDSVVLSPMTINPDLVTIWDSLGIVFNESGPWYQGEIPNCASLKKKENKWYRDQDTVPYCGKCIVYYNQNTPDISLFYVSQYTNSFDIISSKYIRFDQIKIISSYSNGKRDGERNYYDKKGNLIKTDIYSNGEIIKKFFP